MEKLLFEISQFREESFFLSSQQLEQIDQLSMQIGNFYNAAENMNITKLWELLSESLMFWENAKLLLELSHYNQTKFQTYVMIHQRVK